MFYGIYIGFNLRDARQGDRWKVETTRKNPNDASGVVRSGWLITMKTGPNDASLGESFLCTSLILNDIYSYLYALDLG